MTAAGRIRTLYRVFGPYLGPYRWKIAAAYAALAASVLLALARPWPLKLILDSVILGKSAIAEVVPFVPAHIDSWDKHLLLTLLAIALVVIVMIESTFGYAQKILFSSVGHSATTDVMEHVFTHLQMLPRSSDSPRTGDIIVRLTSDIKTLRDLLVNHVQRLGSYGLTIVSTLIVMFLMNWQLTLLGLVVVPFIYATSYYFSRNIRIATKQKRKKEGAVASIVQENLTSMAVVQAFAQEDAERKRFRAEARQSLDASIESAKLGGAFTRTIKVLNSIGTAMVVWLGASRVMEGQMSPGDLVVFAAYIAELYTPVQNISELAVQFMESLVSGERVLGLMRTAPRIVDRPGAVRAPAFQGEVQFDNVTFGYSPGSPVLGSLTFTAPAGKTVALVGGSGAGKSTILNLLLRFFDPWEGRVLIDGRDIRGFKLQSLRSQVSVVLQESVLFRRTVRENIAYGRPGARADEIIAAARAARAHEFIEALPDGYDTVLDEQGANLSGGQRQRIALARAFLRNAPVLVLDEPTSGLDAVTESQLNETLDELARGKTTIIIAHRFSTIERADCILVLDRGAIVQQGTHSELLAQPGLYRELFHAQQTDTEQSTIAK
jgi:ABC-type multidrug transport system fused ATPase/permease subunit